MTLFDQPDEGGDAPRQLPGETVRVRLTVAYDGSGFRGFWPNPGVETVGGVLVATLRKVLNHDVSLTCAGRTDAGVHARGQVVTFDAPLARLDLERLQTSVNTLCGPAVVVTAAAVVADDFDARNSATARHYRYTIINRAAPDPFLAATAWHVTEPLDVRAMRAACDPLIGEHDFASFCRRPNPEATLVRRVTDAHWETPEPSVLVFHISASSFCHQMVRSIVGTLVDVGRGHLRAGDMMAVRRAADRRAAGPVAPPQGLCLWSVSY